MVNISEKKIATPRTFKRSILNDPQVYHWFSFLINRKSIKQKISSSPQKRRNIQTLHIILLIEVTLFSILLILLLYIFKGSDLILLWPAALLASLLIALHYPKKETVATLGMDLLSSDFSNEELSRLTLYQIGEFYSRQYSVIPLVDYIVILDRISQKTIIALLILIFLLRPVALTSYQALAAFPLMLLVVNALSKAIVPYVFKE